MICCPHSVTTRPLKVFRPGASKAFSRAPGPRDDMRKRLTCCELGHIPRALEPADLVRHLQLSARSRPRHRRSHTPTPNTALRVRAQITAVLVSRKGARVRASTVAYRLHEGRQTKVRERRCSSDDVDRVPPAASRQTPPSSGPFSSSVTAQPLCVPFSGDDARHAPNDADRRFALISSGRSVESPPSFIGGRRGTWMVLASWRSRPRGRARRSPPER